MKSLFTAAVVSLLTILCTSAWAASKTVTLSVPGMTCAACPITIKKALTEVDGVTEAEVSFDKKEAVVTFDDTKTDVSTLIEATTDAGYPSRVAQ
jgi:periplasmic mercuric ion binding protein